MSSISDTVEAARNLCPRALVTSCEAGAGRLGMVAVTPDEAWYVVGAGDLAAALLAATYREAAKAALEHVGATLFGMAEAADGGELPLIARQDLIVAPTHKFEAVPV